MNNHIKLLYPNMKNVDQKFAKFVSKSRFSTSSHDSFRTLCCVLYLCTYVDLQLVIFYSEMSLTLLMRPSVGFCAHYCTRKYGKIVLSIIIIQ